jgi:three prime repair exonuclease-1
MTNIETLVYFDLEATGLRSSGKPRICEISLLAVNTQDVLHLHKKIMEHFKTGRKEATPVNLDHLLPRVINKLTLCVYPMNPILPLVSDITGLDNYNLSGQSKFTKNTGNLINSFLTCLPSPVCLVAHNGNAYDFALLKSEMEKVGSHLNTGILCADSYIGIKEIFVTTKNVNQYDELSEEVNNTKIEMDAALELMKAGVFETEMKEGICEGFIATKNNFIVSKEENEKSPSRTGNKVNSILLRKPRKIQSNPRKLSYLNPRPPPSYSLVNLHQHLLGCVPDKSHGAEVDCLTLLRTTAVLGGDWIEWVKENCYLFENCQKMWG